MVDERKDRGFSLLELMTVVAIIGVLSALAVGGLMYGTGRARLQNGVYRTASLLSVAKMRAQSNGRYAYVVVYQAGADFGVRLLESDTAYAEADWTGITGGALPAVQNGKPVVEVDALPLSKDGGYGFYPLSQVAAPAAPFQAIPHAGAGPTPSLLSACSFCEAAASGSAVGVIRFAPDGTVSLPTAAGASGGTLALAVSDPRAGSTKPSVIAFAAPIGAVKVY